MPAILAWLASIGLLAAGAWRAGKAGSLSGVLLCGVLALAFFVAVAMAFMPPPRWYLAIPEFAVVSASAHIWNYSHNQQARIVAFIGIAKLAGRYFWSEGLIPHHLLYAAALNSAFLVQCMIAGGFLDEIGDSLVNRFRAAFGRLAGNGKHGVA